MPLKSARIRSRKGDPYFSTRRGRRNRIIEIHWLGGTTATHRRPCAPGRNSALVTPNVGWR